MASLELYEPRSLDEALELLAQHGDEAKVIAGGTAVVLLLQNRLIAPACLVSLGRLSGLDGLREAPGEGLRIGALASLRQAETSALLRARCPVLAETYGTVANVRVRHAATVGGNLAEADYASDPPAVLVGLRARVTAVSVRGSREIALADFFKDFYETALAPDELLTELRVPEQPAGQGAAYLKYVSRSNEDRPCVGAAAFVEPETDGRCRALRLVISAAEATPRELPAAEALAAGQPLTDALIQEVAERYAAEIEPLDDLRGSAWYRTEMIRVFSRRALEAARARAGRAAAPDGSARDAAGRG
jgi:carbon-monoxide dehydrogenase medium subunit